MKQTYHHPGVKHNTGQWHRLISTKTTNTPKGENLRRKERWEFTTKGNVHVMKKNNDGRKKLDVSRKELIKKICIYENCGFCERIFIFLFWETKDIWLDIFCFNILRVYHCPWWWRLYLEFHNYRLTTNYICNLINLTFAFIYNHLSYHDNNWRKNVSMNRLYMYWYFDYHYIDFHKIQFKFNIEVHDLFQNTDNL